MAFSNINYLCASLQGVPTPPVLVKAEVTPAPKDVPVKKAVPSQFPLLERVKGKSSEQLKALEESFQRSSSPTEADLGKGFHQPVSNSNKVGREEKYSRLPLHMCFAYCCNGK